MSKNNECLIGKQKRPVEEDNELQPGATDNTNNKNKILDHECKCGKAYPKQSALFNHIRIKHDNQKDVWRVPRNVKPGRPSGQNQNTQKVIRKDPKPSHIDDNTWELLNLFKDQLFQGLLIKFQRYMKTELQNQSDQRAESEIWEVYKEERDSLLKKVLPKLDIKPFISRTDFVLQRWGVLLNTKHQLKLFKCYCGANLLQFYDLSDQKQDIVNQTIDKDIVNIMRSLMTEDKSDVSEKFDIFDIFEKEEEEEEQEEPYQEDGSLSGEEENSNQNDQQEDNTFAKNNENEGDFNFLDGQNPTYQGEQHHNMNDNKNNNDVDNEMDGKFENSDIIGDQQISLNFNEMINYQEFNGQQSLLNRESCQNHSFRNQQYYVQHLGLQSFNIQDINLQSIQLHLSHFNQNLNGNADQLYNDGINDNAYSITDNNGQQHQPF